MATAGSKTKRSRNPEAVKARILDAAQEEFMAAGFAAANTNRMLERFGGSKPTMFRHFATKRALFDAVVARIAGRWSGETILTRVDGEEPQDWLQRFGENAIRWILTEENIFVGRMAIAEGNAFPEVSETYRSLVVVPMEQAICEMLAEWTAKGLLRCVDAEADARHFLDLTMSGMVSRRLYRMELDIDADVLMHHVGQCVDLFLNGRQCKTGDEVEACTFLR